MADRANFFLLVNLSLQYPPSRAILDFERLGVSCMLQNQGLALPLFLAGWPIRTLIHSKTVNLYIYTVKRLISDLYSQTLKSRSYTVKQYNNQDNTSTTLVPVFFHFCFYSTTSVCTNTQNMFSKADRPHLSLLHIGWLVFHRSRALLLSDPLLLTTGTLTVTCQ